LAPGTVSQAHTGEIFTTSFHATAVAALAALAVAAHTTGGGDDIEVEAGGF